MGNYSNRQTDNSRQDNPFAFCSVQSEGVLLVIAGLMFYVALAHLHNWIVYYCVYTLIPYVIVVVLYVLGSAALFFGVIYSIRSLLSAFIWIMVACLLANAVYAVMICLDQRCLCDNLAWMSDGFVFHLAVLTVYGFLGFIAGVNFVITLVCVVLVSTYLCDKPYCA